MKLIKHPNGVIVLTQHDGTFITAIPGGQYVHLHPRNDGAILISDRSDAQDERQAVVIVVADVVEAFGVAFNGTRAQLADLLAKHF